MTQPTMAQVKTALDVLAAHLGPTFTGALELHMRDGQFQVMKYPKEDLTRDMLAAVCATERS